MPRAFVRDIADFSGISGVSPPDPRALHVADVVHRATIEVDESGTTARAATAVALAAASPKERPRPAVFRADHPFLFAIHHQPSDEILFFGRVATPLG
jgi:serpin B